jgi:hypothetical protein
MFVTRCYWLLQKQLSLQIDHAMSANRLLCVVAAILLAAVTACAHMPTDGPLVSQRAHMNLHACAPVPSKPL